MWRVHLEHFLQFVHGCGAFDAQRVWERGDRTAPLLGRTDGRLFGEVSKCKCANIPVGIGGTIGAKLVGFLYGHYGGKAIVPGRATLLKRIRRILRRLMSICPPARNAETPICPLPPSEPPFCSILAQHHSLPPRIAGLSLCHKPFSKCAHLGPQLGVTIGPTCLGEARQRMLVIDVEPNRLVHRKPAVQVGHDLRGLLRGGMPEADIAVRIESFWRGRGSSLIALPNTALLIS